MPVHLLRPHLRYQRQFLQAVERSQGLHHPWVYPPATPLAYAAYVRRCRSRPYEGHLLCSSGDEVCGVINISEIVMGSFCSGYLGYYAFEPHAHQGHMTQGLTLVIRRAFEELGLHRLEANIQPHNAASLALARRCGLQREGFSPRYLKIGGEWKDHERWAITLEDFLQADQLVGALEPSSRGVT